MTETRNQRSTARTLSYAIILLFALGIGLMSFFTPKLQEDLEFMASNWRHVEGMTEAINWQGMWDDIKFHQTLTNGRIGDRMVIPALCFLPEWVFALLCAVIGFLTVRGILLAAGVGMKKFPAATLLTVTMLLLWFPWNESMFLASYSMNYLWTACFAIWSARILLKDKSLGESGLTTTIAECAFFLIAGAWHECIFMTLGCAMTITALLSDKRFRSRRLLLAGFMFAGFLYNTLSGGSQTRIAGTALAFDFHHLVFLWHRLPVTTWFVTPVVVYFLCVITAVLNKPSEHKSIKHLVVRMLRTNPLHLTSTLTCLASLLLFGFFGTPRTMILGEIFAITGIVSIYNRHCGNRTKRIINITTAGVCVLMLVNLYVSVAFQAKMRQLFERQKTQWLSSDDGVIFSDIPKMRYKSLYPWEMIISDMYQSPWKHYYLANFIRPENEPKRFILIPSELRNSHDMPKQWLNDSLGIYRIGENLMYSNPDSLNFDINPANGVSCFGGIILDVTTDKGDNQKVYGQILLFINDKGEQQFYIRQIYFNGDNNLNIRKVLGGVINEPATEWVQPPTNYNR